MRSKRTNKFNLEDLKKIREKSTHILLCSKCNEIKVEVETKTVAVICHICCANMGPPIKIQKPEEPVVHKAKGWKFMKCFVDQEGNVFHKGVEQPELKGTLPATVVTKKSKFERKKEKDAKEKKLAEKYEKKQQKISQMQKADG